MANISARLQACSHAIIQNRLQIGDKLDHISQWLAGFQEMIERFKTNNSSRISHLSDTIQGTDITISIQKLMQLSVSKDYDIGLLTDSIQEESLTKKLLEEFESVAKTADVSASGRFNTFLDLPSVPRLCQEFDCTNFFMTDKTSSQWSIVMTLIESLAAFTQNRLVPPKRSVRFIFVHNLTILSKLDMIFRLITAQRTHTHLLQLIRLKAAISHCNLMKYC